MALVQLGDHLEAVRSLERAIAIGDAEGAGADLLLSRYFLGDADRGELLTAMQASSDPVYVGTLAMGLLDHPQPSKRDPVTVLEVLERRGLGGSGGAAAWTFVLRTRAFMELEEWEAARSELAGRYEVPSVALYAPPVITFLRAIVEARSGHEDVGREHYVRGLVDADELMRANPTAWVRSDLVRWRDAAAAVVGD